MGIAGTRLRSYMEVGDKDETRYIETIGTPKASLNRGGNVPGYHFTVLEIDRSDGGRK